MSNRRLGNRFLAAATFLVALILTALMGSLRAAPIDDAVIAYMKHDYATAFPVFRAMADKGDAFAQYNIGTMYLKGQAVKADPAEAAKWYGKAADHDDADSQVALAELYLKGQGVKQDYVEAYKWVLLAIPHYGGTYQTQDQLTHATGVRDQIQPKLTPAQIADAEDRARAWKPSK